MCLITSQRGSNFKMKQTFWSWIFITIMIKRIQFVGLNYLIIMQWLNTDGNHDKQLLEVMGLTILNTFAKNHVWMLLQHDQENQFMPLIK